MKNERCGRDYVHVPHSWQEGPAGDIEYHVCDGSSDVEESLAAHEMQDAMLEKGAYS